MNSLFRVTIFELFQKENTNMGYVSGQTWPLKGLWWGSEVNNRASGISPEVAYEWVKAMVEELQLS